MYKMWHVGIEATSKHFQNNFVRVNENLCLKRLIDQSFLDIFNEK